MKVVACQFYHGYLFQVVDYTSAREYADQLGIPFLETSVSYLHYKNSTQYCCFLGASMQIIRCYDRSLRVFQLYYYQSSSPRLIPLQQFIIANTFLIIVSYPYAFRPKNFTICTMQFICKVFLFLSYREGAGFEPRSLRIGVSLFKRRP